MFSNLNRFFLKTGWIPLVCFLLLNACDFKQPAAFELYGAGEDTVIYSLSREGVSGHFSFSKPGKWDYVFEKPLEFPRNSSLELDYSFSSAAGESLGESPGESPRESPFQVVLEIEGEGSWALPQDLVFLGDPERPGRIRYALPVSASPVSGISIAAALRDQEVSSGKPLNAETAFELKSLRIVPRWYGFTGEGELPRKLPGDSGDEKVFSVSPFVYLDNSGAQSPPVFVIDVPPRFREGEPFELSAGESSRSAGVSGDGLSRFTLEAGIRRFEYAGPVPFLYIPPMALSPEPYPLKFSAEKAPAVLTLTVGAERTFPAVPVPADPGIVLDYPQELWRDPRYEVFRWDAFPQILIFDTADYEVQNDLFRRLAFFTEKAGFRGRLLSDAEIAGLHGWNAHDYRGEDLAAFFELARRTGFPLLPEERELEEILLEAGIILREGGGRLVPGKGALISLSRESPDYLRSQFMVHEGFHGLFFIDEDFREFSSRRWENLSPQAKRFIRSYFDYQHYDIGDAYLVVNEFMAHCLQQSVSQAARYFGENLAGRLNASWRREVLPEKDENSDVWPEIASAFRAEAEAFSSYVNRRWGFSAGRIRRVTIR
jgi:hypothetical protein